MGSSTVADGWIGGGATGGAGESSSVVGLDLGAGSGVDGLFKASLNQ